MSALLSELAANGNLESDDLRAITEKLEVDIANSRSARNIAAVWPVKCVARSSSRWRWC